MKSMIELELGLVSGLRQGSYLRTLANRELREQVSIYYVNLLFADNNVQKSKTTCMEGARRSMLYDAAK